MGATNCLRLLDSRHAIKIVPEAGHPVIALRNKAPSMTSRACSRNPYRSMGSQYTRRFFNDDYTRLKHPPAGAAVPRAGARTVLFEPRLDARRTGPALTTANGSWQRPRGRNRKSPSTNQARESQHIRSRASVAWIACDTKASRRSSSADSSNPLPGGLSSIYLGDGTMSSHGSLPMHLGASHLAQNSFPRQQPASKRRTRPSRHSLPLGHAPPFSAPHAEGGSQRGLDLHRQPGCTQLDFTDGRSVHRPPADDP